MPLHWMKARHLINAPPVLGPKRQKIYNAALTPWIQRTTGPLGAAPWSEFYCGRHGDVRAPMEDSDVLAWWNGEAGEMGLRHCQLVVLPSFGYLAAAYGSGILVRDDTNGNDNLLNWSCYDSPESRRSCLQTAVRNLPEDMRSAATRFIQDELTGRFGDAPW